MREKLIELLRKSVYKWQTDFDFGFEEMADHFIANGVTVTDNNVGCKTDYCSKCHNAVRTDELFVVINPSGRRIETVFNFCPACGRKLPEPPKGE